MLAAPAAIAATIPGISFTEYPASGYTVTAITGGSTGDLLWFTDQNFAQIGSIDLATGQVDKYPLRPATGETVFAIGGAQALAFGGDGNLYFPAVFNFGTASPVSMIGVFNPPTRTLAYLQVPETDAFVTAQAHITAGSDGNVYFTDAVNGKIGVVTPAGTAHEMDVVTASGSRPQTLKGIAYGGNDQVWVTSGFRSFFAMPAAGGTATEHRIQGGGFRNPTAITAAPDGFLYFVLTGNDADEGNKIGRINDAGSLRTWDLPTDNSFPTGIAIGADQSVYVTEQLARQIAQLDPTTGVVNESPVPNGQVPIGIAAIPVSAGSSTMELVFYSLPANLRDGIAQKITIDILDTPIPGKPDLHITKFALNDDGTIFEPETGTLGTLFRPVGDRVRFRVSVVNNGNGDSTGDWRIVDYPERLVNCRKSGEYAARFTETPGDDNKLTLEPVTEYAIIKIGQTVLIDVECEIERFGGAKNLVEVSGGGSEIHFARNETFFALFERSATPISPQAPAKSPGRE
jgi:streptogramin lyase